MRLQSFNAFSHGKLIFALVAISYITLMFGNGFVALTDPDEVFYSQTAVEMVQRNSWFVPYLFDQPQFEKPILCYTLSAILTKIFGATPFIERFWPAFFGILGVVVTYAIAWLLFNDKRTAFLSGLVLATSFIYIALSRAVLTDMVFSIFVTISIGFFYYAYISEKRREQGLVLFFVFAALAVLTKGLLGFCFPLATGILFLISQKNLRFLKSRGTLWGALLFVIIAAPWHLSMIERFGDRFVNEYFYNVHVRRLFEAEHLKSDTWYFYPLTAIGGTFPWVFFLLPALGELIKQTWKRQTFRKEIVLLAVWVLSVFIFLQPAHSKLASYVFPIFPAMAIFIAYFIEQNLEHPSRQRKYLKIGVYGLAVFVFLAGMAALIIGPRYIKYVVSFTPIYFIALSTTAYSILLIRYLRRDSLAKTLAVVPLLPLILIGTILLVKPYIEPWVSCKEVSYMLARIDQSPTVVLVSKFYVRGVRFFTQRPVAVININGKGFFSPHPIPFLNTDQKVLSFLKSQPKTFCVVRMNDLIDLNRIAQKGGFKLNRIADKGGRYIISLEPLSP